MLYPEWLNPGDNAWQMTAATLVGLMSIPGLVVLYGGVIAAPAWAHLCTPSGRRQEITSLSEVGEG